MPAYEYYCAECGATEERVLPISKATWRPNCVCGAVMDRNIAAEQRPRRHVKCGNWPLHSDALAVHPDQIPEAVENSTAKGVPTEFDSWGRPVFTGPAHRRRYCEAYHVFDRDGGYGDPQKRS